MPDDRAPWESSATGQFDPSAQELSELRELILGPERRRLRELERRLEAGATPEELAELLPEAIALRAGRDRQLARALAPTVESAIGESVRRNPREIASAIFPVLGPAIRKAIAETLAGLVASINSTIEHSLSPRGLRWRVEAWRIGVPYAQIVLKHALVYRVEQVLLDQAAQNALPVPAVDAPHKDRVRIAARLELVVGVPDEGHAARHAGAEVPSDVAQNHDPAHRLPTFIQQLERGREHGTMHHKVEDPDAHRIHEIHHRMSGRIGGRVARRRIGFARTRQIQCIDRTGLAQRQQQRHEHPAGLAWTVQTDD